MQFMLGTTEKRKRRRTLQIPVDLQIDVSTESEHNFYSDLSRNVAAQFGSASADDDVDAARAVGALAGQLVRLP